jgi:hypothetical protein
VADYHSNTISAFALNAATGALTPIAGSPFTQSGPYCLATVKIAQ